LPVFLSSATAFTLNIAVVTLVSATSGLTLTLAGKDILLIVTSLFIFEAPITRVQVLGYLVALYGLNCFNLCGFTGERCPALG